MYDSNMFFGTVNGLKTVVFERAKRSSKAWRSRFDDFRFLHVDGSAVVEYRNNLKTGQTATPQKRVLNFFFFFLRSSNKNT